MGHYEDYDFYRLHEEILSANSRPPQGYGQYDCPLEVSASHIEKATSIVADRRSLSVPWGWKDPRTILFLPFWLSLVPEISFLYVYRHPGEVASSLEKRGEQLFQDDGVEAIKLWYWYNKLAFEFANLHPNRVIARDVREIISNPRGLIRDLNLFLETDLSECSEACQPGLLRHTKLSLLPPPYRSVQHHAEALYDDLQILASSSITKDHCAKFHTPVRRKRVAIVTPIHRLPLNQWEHASMLQKRHYLLCYDRIIVAPESLDAGGFGLPVYTFDDHWFDSIDSYSKLLLDQRFYSAFRDYEYILIYQLDALVFSSNLDDWCDQSYDYIGAPWFPDFGKGPAGGLWKSGNGGFSLRKVQTFRQLLDHPQIAAAAALTTQPEDVFWSFEVPRFFPGFRIASVTDSVKFAVESSPRYCFSLNNNALPFGCHYWNRIDADFWMCFLSPEARECFVNADSPFEQSPQLVNGWMRDLVRRLLRDSVSGKDSEEIACILTSDISQELMDLPPTREGIIAVFDRLLGREPGDDWFAFWLERSDVVLSQVRRDLSIGEEFRARCQSLQKALRCD